MKIYLDTSSLIKLYHTEKGLRTLDSILLASVLTIRKDVDIAFSADDLLRNLFEKEGIKTLN